MSWINSMMALVSSDELAKDVTGAEALLERHQVSAVRNDILPKLLHFMNSEQKIRWSYMTCRHGRNKISVRKWC